MSTGPFCLVKTLPSSQKPAAAQFSGNSLVFMEKAVCICGEGSIKESRWRSFLGPWHSSKLRFAAMSVPVCYTSMQTFLLNHTYASIWCTLNIVYIWPHKCFSSHSDHSLVHLQNPSKIKNSKSKIRYHLNMNCEEFIAQECTWDTH